MFALGHDFEIVNRIVEAIPVSMMDDLASAECAPKVALHDDAVFGSQLPAYPDVSVAQPFVNVTALEARMVLAKILAGLNAVRESFRLARSGVFGLGLVAKAAVLICGHAMRGAQVPGRHLAHGSSTKFAFHPPILTLRQHHRLRRGT